MFSPYLFDHKYDIDTILAALCGPSACWLETRTGTISTHEITNIPTSHCFRIEPLPASFINELINNPDMQGTQTHLSDDEKTAIRHILGKSTVQQLPPYFTEGRPGGWLRERVKDAALEWLDGNDLIPPSMRHINRNKAAKLYATRTITIEDID